MAVWRSCLFLIFLGVLFSTGVCFAEPCTTDGDCSGGLLCADTLALACVAGQGDCITQADMCANSSIDQPSCEGIPPSGFLGHCNGSPPPDNTGYCTWTGATCVPLAAGADEIPKGMFFWVALALLLTVYALIRKRPAGVYRSTS
jgi:hypothetical protein